MYWKIRPPEDRGRREREISEITNKISPEHLEIYTKNPQSYLRSIKNAGSVFLGAYSPEAMGDYLAGPNHVLPTTGTAKFSSGLSVYDFLKRQSIIKITKSGIERLGPSVINLTPSTSTAVPSTLNSWTLNVVSNVLVIAIIEKMP